MIILNDNGDGVEPVLKLIRPYRCNSCMFFCCLQKLEVVEVNTGVILAEIKQKWSFFLPIYEIDYLLGNRSYRVSASLDLTEKGIQFLFTCIYTEEIVAKILVHPAKEWDSEAKKGLEKEDGLKQSRT